MASAHQRIGWIDTLRAAAMFLIVLGHCFRAETALENWVYAFHVPLFLLISGMVFSSEESFGRFVKKRVATLAIPYFCFALISIAIYAVIGDYAEDSVANARGATSLLRNLLGMLWGNAKYNALRWNRPMWYLPMFFVMELAGFWLLRLRKLWQTAAELALLIAIAWVTYDIAPRVTLPWDLETVLYLCPLLIVGRLLREARPFIENSRPFTRALLGLALLAAGTVLVPLNGRVKYSSDTYGNNYGLFLLIALTLAVGMLLLASLCSEGIAPLNYVGRNTVGILVMHKFPIMFFVVLPFTRAALKIYPNIASPIIAGLSIGMCMIAIEILRRIAPWSIGIQNQRLI